MVLWASGPSFSADQTGPVAFWILEWCFGPLAQQTLESAHFVVRKSAHFLEYALLSAVWFRAWRQDQTGTWNRRWAVWAIAVALMTAIMDETHQAFVATRSGSERDVLLDLSGACFAQLLIRVSRR